MDPGGTASWIRSGGLAGAGPPGRRRGPRETSGHVGIFAKAAAAAVDYRTETGAVSVSPPGTDSGVVADPEPEQKVVRRRRSLTLRPLICVRRNTSILTNGLRRIPNSHPCLRYRQPELSSGDPGPGPRPRLQENLLASAGS